MLVWSAKTVCDYSLRLFVLCALLPVVWRMASHRASRAGGGQSNSDGNSSDKACGDCSGTAPSIVFPVHSINTVINAKTNIFAVIAFATCTIWNVPFVV